MPDKKLPRHVAIIMDGNGRWAERRLLPRAAGHRAGLKAFIDTVDACSDIPLEVLTVYAFSSENWNRSPDEVSSLIELMTTNILKYEPEMARKNIRLRLMGDIERFGKECSDELFAVQQRLSSNTGMTLCICLSYGGRQEILQAVNKLIKEGKTEVTADDLSACLYTAGLPDPDLVIRTSGEYRISNYLLWQSAYAEYYFTDVLWPDFDKKELMRALDAFSKRKRRFGR